MAFIVYILSLIVTSAVMACNGFTVGTWQYWVIWVCVVMAHISGREWY